MAVKNFNLKNARWVDSRHLENRKIAISHDGAERVSQVATHLRDMICIIVANFVELYHTAAEIS